MEMSTYYDIIDNIIIYLLSVVGWYYDIINNIIIPEKFVAGGGSD